jgi:hypothetical protein
VGEDVATVTLAAPDVKIEAAQNNFLPVPASKLEASRRALP